VKTLLTLMNKGGVGKTTLVRLLMCEMARRGLNVVGIDTDPQGTLSFTMGVRPQAGFYTWTAESGEPDEKNGGYLGDFEKVAHWVDPSIYTDEPEPKGSIWLIPSNWSSDNVPAAPVSPLVIRHQLLRASDQYAMDVAIIDPPPSESRIHPWLLYSADYVLLPAELSIECFAERPHDADDGAVYKTMRYIEQHQPYRAGVDLPPSQVIGIQPVKYEPQGWGNRKMFWNSAVGKFGDLMWKPIESRKDWTEAASLKQSVIKYAPNTPAADQAMQFVDRVMEHMGFGVKA
jgi:cellulose biosynthesis protein BcsQ